MDKLVPIKCFYLVLNIHSVLKEKIILLCEIFKRQVSNRFLKKSPNKCNIMIIQIICLKIAVFMDTHEQKWHPILMDQFTLKTQIVLSKYFAPSRERSWIDIIADMLPSRVTQRVFQFGPKRVCYVSLSCWSEKVELTVMT